MSFPGRLSLGTSPTNLGTYESSEATNRHSRIADLWLGLLNKTTRKSLPLVVPCCMINLEIQNGETCTVGCPVGLFHLLINGSIFGVK